VSKRTKWLLVIGVIAALVLGLQIAAFAGPVGNAQGFEDDDGNLAPQAPINFDWNSFTANRTWTGTAPNRRATGLTNGFEFVGIEDWQATTADSAFAGGTKQDDECATVGTGKAPNKDDLKRVYLATKTVPVNGVDHVFLDLAWVRIPQNTTSPSAHIGFEFNKAEPDTGSCNEPGGLVERTDGDMLIVYDFEGSSTNTPTLTLRRWTTDPADSCEVGSNSPPCWGPATTLPQGVAEARVNTSVVGPVQDTVAPTTETLGLNEFGEAGIDLTAAGVFTADDCEGFGTAFAVSRSSGNSATAQMKDLAGPTAFDIKNCGQIIIRKETVPTPDETDTTFNFTAEGGLDPAIFGLKDQEAQDYGNEVPKGNYDVTEADPGPNFALTDIDCSASDLGNGSTATPNLQNRTVDIQLEPEDTVDCTFTNTLQEGALKILKQSTKAGNPLVSNPGAVFSYDSSSVTDNGEGDEDPTVGEVCVSGLLPGDYTVDETTPPPGYGNTATEPQTATVVTGSDCTDNEPTGSAVVTFTNPPLADIQVRFRDGGSGETRLTPGETITCDNPTGTDDTSDTTDWDDTLTVSGIEAGATEVTVTCTIPIDP
jgi:hypothetical protein